MGKHTSSSVVVVVIDGGDAPQFVRCLTQVCGTVPEQTQVVGVSSRFPRLPSHLASRVEQVRVHHADEVAVAVDDLVSHEPASATVLAVAARSLLRSGWFEAATEAAEHIPYQIGVYGVGAPRLLRVMPGGIAPSRLTTYPLASLPGITEEPAVPAGTSVPSPRTGVEATAAVRA